MKEAESPNDSLLLFVDCLLNYCSYSLFLVASISAGSAFTPLQAASA